MKRVLTLATTGLFVTGLALLPLAANADQAVGGKDGKMAPAAAAAAPAAPVKKADDRKVTASPAAAGTATPAKPPVKTGS